MAGAMAVAERVAARLGAIPGVVAVALGGSWARGEAQAGSDVDLGLYYRPDRRPALAALNRLAGALDDRRPTAAVSDFGAWGPWIDGGAWLVIEGQRVDWLFRNLDRVASAVACVVQVLFAVNGRWFVNEKGAVRAVTGMARRPPGFARTVARLLGHPGATPAALETTLGRGLALVVAVERLAAEAGLPYGVERAGP